MQIKNSFDKETKRKIWSSFKWALSGPVGVALIDWSTKAPQDVWWGVLVAYALPIIVNAVKEYKAGSENG